MIFFWLVLKLEISSYTVIIVSRRNFLVSFRGFFLKIIFFLHGEILEFP
jgi:hypothetical protein